MITLTTDYMRGPAARSVPGAFYDHETKAWVLEHPTPRAAAVALRMFPNLGITHPELNELRQKLGADVRPFDNATQFDMAVGAEGVRHQLRCEGHDFYNFQAIDLGYMAAVLLQHKGAYLGWERGLGKTIGAAALIDELDCRTTLVVCPNTAKRSVWEPELHRLLPETEVIVLRNSAAQRERDLGYVRQLWQGDTPFVLVAHYEALDIIGGTAGRGWQKFGCWDMVIADEVHRISNPKTKMARALKKIPTTYKLALSGSIIQNHAEELFSPLQWLFPANYSSKWRDFNDRFLDYVDSGYARVCVGVRMEKLQELRAELGVFMTYRRKEDELDLPARTEETRYVELGARQRKVYDDLVEDSLAELPDGSYIKAQEGLVLLTRLRQVATGLDLFGKGLADSSKQDLAFDLIMDNPDEAFVVFSWYKAAAYSLGERLTAAGIGNYVVTGDTKHDKRADLIREFQEGSGRVFIGTLSTLGESITLHRASNAIFLDRSWNPGVNAQAADRIYRIGQTKPVLITHIVARATVDELRVQPVIEDKDQLRRLILGG